MIKRTGLIEIYRYYLAFHTLIVACGRVAYENGSLKAEFFNVELLLSGYGRQRGVAKGFALFTNCSSTLHRSGYSPISCFHTIWNR